MKKFLRLTLVALLALFCGTTYAQNAVFDFSENEWGLPEGSSNKGTETKDFSNGTYTITLANGYYFNEDGYLMLGKTNATLTLPAFDFEVGKIEVEGRKGASASTMQNIFVGDVTVSTETKGVATTNTYVIDENYRAAGTRYTLKVTSSHNSQIVEIRVYSASSLNKKDAGLSFSEEKVTVALNGDFTAPELTYATDAPVTYSSDNTDVATVDAKTGEVTLIGVGTATITASAEENDEYIAGQASYIINVTAPVLSEVSVPYTESFETSIGSFTIDDVNIGDLDYVWSLDEGYKCMKATSYVNKNNNDAESWLVSPTINLENLSEATMTFEHCVNKFFGTIEDEATLWIKIENGEWEPVQITYPTVEEKATFSDWASQEIKLSEYLGKKIKVGFKYIGTAKTSGTWEIRNFSVTGTTTGIENITVEPEFDENAPVYNLAGQRVSKDTKGILIQNGKKFINR